MLSSSGSYDFGGLTAIRHIQSSELVGRSGFLFVFIIRQRITRGAGDECLFQFKPVFTSPDGEIDNELLAQAITGTSLENAPAKCNPPDPSRAFNAAKAHVENEVGLWDWVDDVEFLAMSWTEFK